MIRHLSTMLLVAATVLAVAAPAVAQADNNAGTVKVHDEEDTRPEMRNVPHVSCGFFIEAFNLNDGEGRLVFYKWPPTGDKTVVTPTGDALVWEGEAQDDGNFRFLQGPYFLDPGHYRVEVYTEDGHPGHQHFAKTKTFWVEPCDVPFDAPPCPPNVTATALSGEDVLVSWTSVEDADGHIVYRAVGDDDFEMIATLGPDASSFTDNTTEEGVTYSYYVTAFTGDVESSDCGVVEVTAIPFFPTLVIGTLSVTGTVGAYAWFRRR